MLTEEFGTLSNLLIEQPLKDETGSSIGEAGMGYPCAYENSAGFFCCYQIKYESGTVRLLHRAESAPKALRGAIDNLSVYVYGTTNTSANFDRWQGFPEVQDAPEASDRVGAKDWAGAAPYLARLADREIAWARAWLGIALQLGLGMERDLQAGIRWTTLAAEQGDPGSNDMLAALYQSPESAIYDEAKYKYFSERAALCGIGTFAGAEKPMGPRGPIP